MYKIKRHKLLNLYYVHDQYSGPITDEYEVVDEVLNWSQVHGKLKDYQAKEPANIDGIFEHYYKYEHMKEIWGDINGIQPSVGQLFFICLKESYDKKRNLFELCEVKSIKNEPQIYYYNHAASKGDKMTISQFQGLALIPERDEAYIQNWEGKVKIRYPRNLINQLVGMMDYRQSRNRRVGLAQYIEDWDLPKVQLWGNKVIGA